MEDSVVHRWKTGPSSTRRFSLDQGTAWCMVGLMMLGVYWLPFRSSPHALPKTNEIRIQSLVTVPPKPAKTRKHFAVENGSGYMLFQSRKTARLFQAIIREAADRYDVEPEMVKAIIMAESSYNPVAVSDRGAVGLMQLMPETAEEMGVEDRFDPRHNIHGGVRYFRFLLDEFDNDPEMALAAYNAGISRVREFEGIPPFRATQFYVQKVLTYYHCYKKLSPMDLESA